MTVPDTTPTIQPDTPSSEIEQGKRPTTTRIGSAGETPRLIPGEKIEDFHALFDEIKAYFKPQNIVEHFFVKDYMLCEWEARRLRALSAAMYSAARPFAVAKLCGFSDARFCDSPLPRGTYQASIEDLRKKGYDPAHLNAQGVLLFSEVFETVDKRLAVVEARRDQALMKLEDRRSAEASAMKTISANAKS